MFDIGWMEMLMIAVVAIIVIGPKDLPKVLHTVGQWVARARAVARNFQDQMDEMARQSGVDDVRKQIQNSMTGLDPAERLRREIDPTGEMDAQMKAMADLGRIEPDLPSPPANAPQTSAEVAVRNAEAQAGHATATEPPPEPPLEPGQTAYKGPTP